MEAKQQEYFVAIVEEKSISKAAKRLFVSQPTLSQFLSKLEKSLNTKLVVRKNNGVLSLTKAGELYYDCARQILDICNEFDRRFADLDQNSENQLVIGNNIGKADVLSSVVEKLLPKYPRLQLDFRHGNAYKLLEMVMNGEIDMASSAYVNKNPKLDYIEYPPMEELLVMHKSHPMAKLGKTDYRGELPRISLKAMEDESFVLLRKTTVMRDILDLYCEEQDIHLNAAVVVYDSNFARAAVKAGLGISLYVAETLNMQPQDEDLRYMALDPPLYYHTALYYKKAVYQSSLFRDYLKEIRTVLSRPGEQEKYRI